MVDLLNTIDPWAYEYAGLGVYHPPGALADHRMESLIRMWNQTGLAQLLPSKAPSMVHPTQHLSRAFP